MKRILILLGITALLTHSKAQLNYNFTATSGVFTPLTGGTPTFTNNTADDVLSSAITLPFTFYYNCQPYTQIKISSNGWLTFDMSKTTSLFTNNLSGTSLIIAPLWDDLQCTNDVRCQTSGTFPNRIFTIEWLNMEWNYAANTAVISFQVKLYETSNRIEFIYRDENSNNVYNGSASIGLSGAVGQFLSLNNTWPSPTPSSTSETTSLNTEPATGQVYRWDPIQCSGTPSGFTLSATPYNRCANFTTTLNLVSNSNSGCGLTYQFETSTNLITWTTFSTGVTTATYNINGLRYFRAVITCPNSGQSFTTNTVTTNVISSPCVCGLIQIPSLPYSDVGRSTCGEVNDVKSSNVSNVCGSSSYYTGEDAVYSFTPTATGQIDITLNSSGSYTGLMLYQGCPLSGGTCIANAQSSTGNKTLKCVNVTAGQVYYLVIDSYASLASPACYPFDLSISGVNTAVNVCNMNYSASSIPFNFETFTGTSLPMTDDVLFSTIVMFGFSTCFDGGTYWGGYPASNSSFVFDAVCNIPNIQTSTIAGPGVSTGYSISSPAPVFGTSIPRNAILGPWHDINPATSATVATSKIQYATFGVAPNRRVVISWEDIPYFSFFLRI